MKTGRYYILTIGQLILICLIMFTSLHAVAQTVVDGYVVESVTTNPIQGVNVIVKNRQGKLVAFSTSKENGEFTLQIRQPSDSLTIHASMLGYKPYSAPLEISGERLRITMKEGSLQLPEMEVKGARIRGKGDTISYSVSSFAQKQDRTIGDVLKRMPGIDVSRNGKIQYQGTDINKFYIEGSDLLGGKYGIATNGISHEDIGTVEVMENHQPMQVLRGLSFSEQAAINLKMKDKSKATLLVHGTLGGGWSEQPEGALWHGDIFTMMVRGGYQMITTFKGNNTGDNLAKELTDHSANNAEENIERYISVSTPRTPNLEPGRSLMNRSWLISSSHLKKTHSGADVKAQVDYIKDRNTAYGSSMTTYLFDNGERIITETQSSLSHRDALAGRFSFEINEKKYFLSNILSADFSWNDISLDMEGSLQNRQDIRNPEYSITNQLKVIRRFGNRLVTFHSLNGWKSLPENLVVSPAGPGYGESIRQHSFLTDERASLSLVLRRVLLSFEAGLSGYGRKLHTNLWGIEENITDDYENMTTDYLRVFASPRLEWSHRSWELRLNVPINLYTYFFSGVMADRTEIFLSPSLTARFKPVRGLTLSFTAAARRSPASLHNIHDSSILSNYRSFSTGIDDYYTSSGQSLSAMLSFRSPRKGIFLVLTGRYGWNHSKFGTVQDVRGDYVYHSYRPIPSDSRNASAFLTASKTLDFMNGSVGIRGTATRNFNNLLSQGIPTDYRNDALSVTPFLNGGISSFMNWNLGFSWERTTLAIEGMKSRNTENFRYSANITFTPCNLVTWTSGGEFYRNQIEEGRFKETLMLDSKLIFNIGKRLEISAGISNILGHKVYNYTTYNSVSQIERSSLLRGREFIISLYLKK